MRAITIFILCFFTMTLTAQEGNAELTKGDFINLNIKNKSLRFIRGYVEGPKKNGGSFSYGLNVGPYTKIKKYWSIGTKLYAYKGGKQVLIYEVRPQDKGKTVDIANWINEHGRSK